MTTLTIDQQPSQVAPDPNEFHSVSVDTRSLLKFLASYTIASTTIACTLILSLGKEYYRIV